MAPVVRVVDAALHAQGGPVQLVVSGLEQSREVVDAVLHAGAAAHLDGERVVVSARPTQLVDAAGRTGGAGLAEPLRTVVDEALAAWDGLVPAVPTAAGLLPTDEGPVVMGIVNVTPDSFSDGGQHADTAAAVAHGRSLVEAGAGLLDVGGESSRPGADPVDLATELARVVPVVEELAGLGHVVSVDTTKAEVADQALQAGASLVNDVSAGRDDPELLAVVAARGSAYVLMHRQGTAADMQDAPTYGDVVAEVTEFLADGLGRLAAIGVPPGSVVVDPGFGFGKALEHDLLLLRRLRELTSLGRPVLAGLSRKSWLGTVTGVGEPRDRLVGSAVAAALAVSNGARMVRVHDVAATCEALAVAHAVAGAGSDTGGG